MYRKIFISFFIISFSASLFWYLSWGLPSVWLERTLTGFYFSILAYPWLRRIKYLARLIFAVMGFMSFFLLTKVVVDILIQGGLPITTYWAIPLAMGLSLISFAKAKQGPQLTHHQIDISQFNPQLAGLRIVQISDLHIGPAINRDYVEKLVQTINQLSPDIITLTGDIGDGPAEQYRTSAQPLGLLKSRLGVFYVPGNHEYYWNANEWLTVMNNLKMIVLVNRGKNLVFNQQKVFIGGLPDPMSSLPLDIMGVAAAAEDQSFKILLSHRPGIAHQASQAGFHLQLSGHTHGGQFFPWTLVVKYVHPFHRGFHQIKQMWLNVNCGTGLWGPFMRLGTRSEITLIELTSGPKSLA